CPPDICGRGPLLPINEQARFRMLDQNSVEQPHGPRHILEVHMSPPINEVQASPRLLLASLYGYANTERYYSRLAIEPALRNLHRCFGIAPHFGCDSTAHRCYDPIRRVGDSRGMDHHDQFEPWV